MQEEQTGAPNDNCSAEAETEKRRRSLKVMIQIRVKGRNGLKKEKKTPSKTV